MVLGTGGGLAVSGCVVLPALLITPSWRAAAIQSTAQQDEQAGPCPWRWSGRKRGRKQSRCIWRLICWVCQLLQQEPPPKLFLIKQYGPTSHSEVFVIRLVRTWSTAQFAMWPFIMSNITSLKTRWRHFVQCIESLLFWNSKMSFHDHLMSGCSVSFNTLCNSLMTD